MAGGKEGGSNPGTHLAIILSDEISSFVGQCRQRGIIPDVFGENQRASLVVHPVVDFFHAGSGEHKSFQRLGVFGAKFGGNVECHEGNVLVEL